MIHSMRKGDRRTLSIAITDDGDPLNLTDLTVTWMAKRRYEDADEDAVISKTEVDGITITAPPTGGLLDVLLEPEDTADLLVTSPYLNLFWDLRLSNGDGTDVQHPVRGRLQVRPIVTGT